MSNNTFKAIFLVGLVAYLIVLYRPNMKQYRKTTITMIRSKKLDRLLDVLTDMGQIIPIVYVFTPWLGFANFRLPTWLGFVGVAIFIAALYLLWNAYTVIGRNFSPRIEIGEQQTLITLGAYHYIRHPIYAGFWLWGIAQPLLLHNWIAGFAMLATFLPLYLVRAPREEQMLLEHFGETYRAYMDQTGRVIPRLKHGR